MKNQWEKFERLCLINVQIIQVLDLKDLQKSIDNDPNIQKHKAQLQSLEKQMLFKIQQKIDKDAVFAAKMKNAGFPKAKA